MADVIITVTDPDTGVSTVFESLQLDADTEPLKKQKNRPQHRDRSQRYKSTTTLPTTQTDFLFEDENELKPCSYYRQKYCCRGHYELPQDLNSWLNYMAVKKSAGEKVVRKMASQQQQLAAEATDQKRNHVLLLPYESKQKTGLPPKKKTLKLQPLPMKALTPVK